MNEALRLIAEAKKMIEEERARLEEITMDEDEAAIVRSYVKSDIIGERKFIYVDKGMTKHFEGLGSLELLDKGIEIIASAQENGLDVRAETCTHYLILTDEILKRDDGVKWVCQPPLRNILSSRFPTVPRPANRRTYRSHRRLLAP